MLCVRHFTHTHTQTNTTIPSHTETRRRTHDNASNKEADNPLWNTTKQERNSHTQKKIENNAETVKQKALTISRFGADGTMLVAVFGVSSAIKMKKKKSFDKPKCIEKYEILSIFLFAIESDVIELMFCLTFG